MIRYDYNVISIFTFYLYKQVNYKLIVETESHQLIQI